MKRGSMVRGGLWLRVALGDEIHERGGPHALRYRIVGAGEDARQRGGMAHARQQQKRKQRNAKKHQYPP